MRSNKNAIIFAVALPITFMFSVLIHEYGHVLGAKMVGVDNLRVYVWPGYELTPQFGRPFDGSWPKGNIAFGLLYKSSTILQLKYAEDSSTALLSIPSLEIQYLKNTYIPLTRTQDGVIALMGSTLNLLISFIAALIIYKFRPNGVLLVISVCGALLYYDILFYTVFPTFLNLPHLIFWGGNAAEPIIGLSNLGIDSNISITMVISLSIIQSLFLYNLFVERAKLVNNKGLTSIANNLHPTLT